MKLKKTIETLITLIVMILTLCIFTINDIEIKAIPFVLLVLAIDLFLIYILKKYGRGIFYENN